MGAAYRHSMSAVCRSSNRSATGAAAYRSGSKLVDVRTGVEYDYTRKSGVAASHLVVPGAAIDAIDRQALWAAVEKKHTRGDAVPAREIVISLPHQLDPIDRTELALRYARELSDRYGVAVDVAVHLPSIKPGHDIRNHHAHLLMSACSVRADAGALTCGKKVEALDPIASKRRGGEPVAEVERASWASLVRQALAASGVAGVIVDHRSYERQGIEQVPQIHLGPDAHDNLLRHREKPGEVPLLARTVRYLEIEAANDHLAIARKYEAEAAELEQQAGVAQPTSTELTPVDEPAPTPAPTPAPRPWPVVVPIRPVHRESAPAPPPAAIVAYSPPAAVPAVRSKDDLDGLIADAEARLAALEEREKTRQKAAEAYKRSQSDLQAVKAGAWARFRAFVGLGPTQTEKQALGALRSAEQAAKSVGGVTTFGKLSMPSDTAERVEIKKQLMGLRDERGGLVAETVAAERRTVAAVDKVIELVRRADAVVPVDERQDWPALRALDRAGGLQQLREQLSRDPGLAIALAHDLGRRLPEIEGLEQAALDVISPAAGGGDLTNGLLTAIDRGPAKAYAEHWRAWLGGCEKRGQITPEEFALALQVLSELPAAGPQIEREELARLVVDQAADDQPAPGM